MPRQKTAEINLQVTIEGKQAREALKGMKGEISGLINAMNDLEEGTNDYAVAQKKASEAVAKFISEASPRELAKFQKELNKELREMPQNTEYYRRLSPIVAQVNSKVKELNGSVKVQNTALSNTSSLISKMTTSWKAFAAAAGVGLLIQAGTALFNFGKELIGTSGQLELARSKFQTVFGEAAGFVEEFAANATERLGLASAEIKSLTANFADLLIPLGFTRKTAAELSTGTLELAAALSRWSNGTKTAAETQEILQSAMLGEYEGLKQLGIAIDADEVKRRVQTNGLKDLNSEQQKQAETLAILQLILEKSTDAQQGFANATKDISYYQREANAQFEEARNKLADALAPAFLEVTKAVSSFTRFVADLIGYLTDADRATNEYSTTVTIIGAVLMAFGTQIDRFVIKPIKGIIGVIDQVSPYIKGWAITMGIYVPKAIKPIEEACDDVADTAESTTERLHKTVADQLKIIKENAKLSAEALAKQQAAADKAAKQAADKAAKEADKAAKEAVKQAAKALAGSIAYIEEELKDAYERLSKTPVGNLQIPIIIDIKTLQADLEAAKKIARDLFYGIEEEVDNLASVSAEKIAQSPLSDEFWEKSLKNRKEILEYYSLEETTKREITALQQESEVLASLSGGFSELASSMGEATVAGQVLSKMSQALAVAQNVAAVAAGIKAISLAAGQPFPANIVAITSTLSALAAAIVSVKNLMKFRHGGILPEAGRGGMALGPNHESGGIKLVDSNTGKVVGEVEGGEPIASKAFAKQNPELTKQILWASKYNNGVMPRAMPAPKPLSPPLPATPTYAPAFTPNASLSSNPVTPDMIRQIVQEVVSQVASIPVTLNPDSISQYQLQVEQQKRKIGLIK